VSLPPEGIVGCGHLGLLLGEIIQRVEIRINLVKNDRDFSGTDPADLQIEIRKKLLNRMLYGFLHDVHMAVGIISDLLMA
jgi:hypothetical protein